MKVLVAYASKHGSTQGIAERIGARLSERGLDADVRPAAQVTDPAPYDAFVVGGAAYMFHWMKDAADLVRRHRSLLASRPAWLFSSGPLGTETVDAAGKDVRQAAEPKELEELERSIHPRATRVFFGAFDPEAKPIGIVERLMQLAPASAETLPAGDFRDWEAIDAFADEISAELAQHAAPVGG